MASSREVDGRTVYIGRSLPIRIRYEAEWGEPDGTGLPMVRFFYRDRWLNTWAVGARAHLDGELDRALGGQRMLPALYQHLNPLTERESLEKEEELARELRACGYTVIWS